MSQDWREMTRCTQCGCERRITGLMGANLVTLSTAGGGAARLCTGPTGRSGPRTESGCCQSTRTPPL